MTSRPNFWRPGDPMATAARTSDGAVLPPSPESDGRFADNIVFFARALRKAGLKIGPGRLPMRSKPSH